MMLQKFLNVIVRVCFIFSLKNNYQLFHSVFSDSHNILLPIKPKPLLYPKDSTLMYDSRHNSKVDHIADVILVSLFLAETNQLHVENINHEQFSFLFSASDG